ncbi:MAG: Lrp/AsnC family transcriptional regulator [Chloroflexi bacterium]|nr:Lrp/AsnC family transcriptional regulator [Chloroflexota bacterium]MCL5275426.1 Lrp/AsnC family transcriptional regulator [Chloroflexota bacterium]
MSFALNTENLLDSTGWQILRVLQENARISFSELGRQVGLSAPAVAERVRKLEETGIISGYHAEINPASVGYSVLAFIRIGSTGQNSSRCAEAIRDIQEVLECHRVTGSDSFFLKVIVPSINHLEALIDQLQPYGETTTTLVLSSAVTRRTIEHGPLGLSEAPVQARA